MVLSGEEKNEEDMVLSREWNYLLALPKRVEEDPKLRVVTLNILRKLNGIINFTLSRFRGIPVTFRIKWEGVNPQLVITIVLQPEEEET